MRLHHQEFGQGEPLIILHGFLGSGDNWRSIARHLGQHYHCYVVDLRNHGMSFHDADCSYSAMAGDVSAFINEHRIYAPTLMGHSMGGKVAMQVAFENEEQIKSLVVVDIAPKPYENRHGGILEAMYRLSLSDFSALTDLDAALSQDIPVKELRAFILKNMARDAGMFKWKINVPILRDNIARITEAPILEGRIDVPSLFIKGAYSDYIDVPEDESLIASFFENYYIDIVPKAGHWVHAQNPEVFLNMVQAFLTDV